MAHRELLTFLRMDSGVEYLSGPSQKVLVFELRSGTSNYPEIPFTTDEGIFDLTPELKQDPEDQLEYPVTVISEEPTAYFMEGKVYTKYYVVLEYEEEGFN